MANLYGRNVAQDHIPSWMRALLTWDCAYSNFLHSPRALPFLYSSLMVDLLKNPSAQAASLPPAVFLTLDAP